MKETPPFANSDHGLLTKPMSSNPQQIPVPNSLDVEAIERLLADLWKRSVEHSQDAEDEVVLRSRVAALMVFLSNESLLSDTQQIISELAAFHPCRALLLVGDRKAAGRDIEMYVAAFCSSQKRSESTNLCCEEITLTAHGQFVSELPSAALPLLVPDLPIFLWWRAELGEEEKLFRQLCVPAHRLVIDSADFQNTPSDLAAVMKFLRRRDDEAVLFSDINWARLTPWRASLANFYDVAEYRAELDQITDVQIHFVAQAGKASGISSQPLLIAAWLASRLKWKFAGVMETQLSPKAFSFQFKKDESLITLSVSESQHPEMKSGRLCEIQLKAPGTPATFLVRRGEDGLHLETQTTIGECTYPGRLLRLKNSTAAQLLSREMEILSHDQIYEEAIVVAAEMMKDFR